MSLRRSLTSSVSADALTRRALLRRLAGGGLATLGAGSAVRGVPADAANATPAAVPTGASPAAEILWDEWGTPHIFADESEKGLFRGFGWAQMHSHGNLLRPLYAQSRGTAAEYGGADFLEVRSRRADDGAARARAGVVHRADAALPAQHYAFAAGVNEYAAAQIRTSSHRTRSSRSCRSTGPDLLAHVARVVFIFVAGESNCEEALPPSGVFGPSGTPGSNGWGIGPSHTANGNAMLLANPHLIWGGEHTFYEAHLVMPGL